MHHANTDAKKGHEAFRGREWSAAYEHLTAADRADALGPADLEALAVAAHVTGRHSDSVEIQGRAHQGYIDADDPVGAARCAFWLGFQFLMRGERTRGGGWVGRAEALLDAAGVDCEERGWVLIPRALRLLASGDVEGAYAVCEEAGRIGERFGSRDLRALSLLGRGQSRIRSGNIEAGLALLDEAMAAVDAGDVGPVVVGTVYCAVIRACHEICDLARAREWTAVLDAWCGSQPDLVLFRGECLVRRTEILRLQGDWPDALDEARRASQLLTQPDAEPGAGAAYYEQGELHRLRGEFREAEEAYREASEWGHTPQPGLALLRMAQGRMRDATTAIRRLASEAASPARQSSVLPACVEIMLSANDVDAAREAADALASAAKVRDVPLLQAQAAAARGAVCLAEGNLEEAMAELRAARAKWDELDAPYEAARVQEHLARALHEVGDADTARIELEGAVRIFERLGAHADLARIAAEQRSDVLTPRELEVLRLVAAGATNRAIGEALFISERTVERHVSHILAKLGVPTRAAATAYAYERGFV